MIELKVKFYEVEKDGLPTESGNYLCFAENLYCTTFPFSSRHKAFNCYDNFDKADTKIDVVFWTDCPIGVIERRCDDD